MSLRSGIEVIQSSKLKTQNSTLLDVLVLLGYALLTLVFTFPLATHLGSYVAGLDVDAEEYLWSFWWMRKAALELHTNPFFTNWLYYPSGVSLYFFAFNPLHAFLSIPLQQLFGLVVAYNLMGLLTFVVSGYTTYLLARDITGSRSSSFIAGVLFAFAPTQVFHFNVGQPNLQAVEFLPLYVLCVRRWLKGDRVRWLLGAAIALALCSLNDWQFAIYAQLFTAALLLAELWARRSAWRATTLALAWRSVLLEALYALAVAPIIVPMVAELTGPRPYMVRKRSDSVYHSADLLAFLVPNPLHPLWRSWAEPLRLSLQTPGVLVTVVSLSYVGMLLALVAIWRRWREARFWFITGLLFLIFALGPELLVNGRSTGLPMPYELLFQLPIIQISRAPARYVTVTLLCLAVLAAMGVQALEQKAVGGRQSAGSEGKRQKAKGIRSQKEESPAFVFRLSSFVLVPRLLILGALVFELLPAPVSARLPAATPAFFTDGTLRDAGALLEIPNPSNRGMYFATVHDHPVMYGELSRDNPGGPLLDYLRNALFQDDIIDDANSWRCMYAAFNITHAVLYPKPEEQALQQQIEKRLPPGSLVSATPQGRLYRMPTSLSTTPCVLIGQGWQGARVSTPGEPLHRWTGQSALLGVFQRQAGAIRLHFTANSFAIPRQLEVRMGETVVDRLDIGAPQEYTLDLDLPTGITWLELHSVQSALSPKEYGYSETEPIAIGYTQIRAEAR